MTRMSREAQTAIENMPIEETPLSAEQKQDIYDRVMKKMENRMPEAVPFPNPKRRIKPVYLVAAAITTFALLGAGYATSAYFNRMYSTVDVPAFEQYDLETDDPQFLVEPPDLDAAENGGSPVVVDGYGAMEPVFEGRTPGEQFQVEIQSPDQKWWGEGIAGNGINVLYLTSERGVPTCQLVINPKAAPSTQQVLDSMVGEGQFLVTLDHPGYTPVNLEQIKGTSYWRLTYSDGEGKTVYIDLDRINGRIPLSQERVDNAVIEEFEEDGYQYVLIQDAADQNSLDLYLGEYLEVVNTMAHISSPYATREQMMDIMAHLTIRNPGANAVQMAGEEFFAAFPQEDIRANAAEIAAAVRDSNGDGGAAWEKNGISVKKLDPAGRLIDITLETSFDVNSPVYPFGIHTALIDQDWFPKGAYHRLSIGYEDLKPAFVGYQTKEGKSGFGSVLVDNGFAVSPLDAILYQMTDGNTPQQVAIIDSNPAGPIVMVASPDGDSATIYSATGLEDGRFLVQMIGMAMEDLPLEFQNRT